jgi:hypothetical protein
MFYDIFVIDLRLVVITLSVLYNYLKLHVLCMHNNLLYLLKSIFRHAN